MQKAVSDTRNLIHVLRDAASGKQSSSGDVRPRAISPQRCLTLGGFTRHSACPFRKTTVTQVRARETLSEPSCPGEPSPGASPRGTETPVFLGLSAGKEVCTVHKQLVQQMTRRFGNGLHVKGHLSRPFGLRKAHVASPSPTSSCKPSPCPPGQWEMTDGDVKSCKRCRLRVL